MRYGVLIQSIGALGALCLRKGGAVALSCIAVEGELRNEQHLSLYVADGEIHLARFVLKDAERRDLFHRLFRLLFDVARFYPEIDDEPAPDLGHELIAHTQGRGGDALCHKFHG